MAYHLVPAGTADEQRRRLVRDSLGAYNRTVCPDMQSGEHPGHLDMYLLDKQGQVQGGLLGLIRWRWLQVDEMALAPHLRRQGSGSRMLRLAEAEARKRGCTRSVLDTASFQARPFYEKLGYRVIGELPNVLPGAGSYWLAKELPADQEERPGVVAPGYELVVCDAVDEARRKQVAEMLMAYNVTQNEAVRQAYESGHWGDPLDVYLLDEQGDLAGGLLAGSHWHMLYLGDLWTADGVRGQGWGRRMLELAEAEAHKRGCTQAQTHIHSFQGPGFWRKLGYRNIGEIDDFPPGYALSWLTKDL